MKITHAFNVQLVDLQHSLKSSASPLQAFECGVSVLGDIGANWEEETEEIAWGDKTHKESDN